MIMKEDIVYSSTQLCSLTVDGKTNCTEIVQVTDYTTLELDTALGINKNPAVDNENEPYLEDIKSEDELSQNGNMSSSES